MSVASNEVLLRVRWWRHTNDAGAAFPKSRSGAAGYSPSMLFAIKLLASVLWRGQAPRIPLKSARKSITFRPCREDASTATCSTKFRTRTAYA